MNKTIHKKLTAKQIQTQSANPIWDDELFATIRDERKILESLSKEMLSPRQEALDRLLALAKKI
jgi:hypothetical protein